MKVAFALALVVSIAPVLIAQTTSPSGEQPKEPQTKLEQFQAKKGSVIIRGFSPVGKLEVRYGSTVSVETREFIDATTGAKEYGVAIEVKESGRLERESSSYIDADEIDSLVKGIEYIGRVNKSATKLADFQADYRTRGDFSVSTFSDQSGQVGASVKSGRFGPASAFMEIGDLVKLRDLLLAAQKMIKDIQ